MLSNTLPQAECRTSLRCATFGALQNVFSVYVLSISCRLTPKGEEGQPHPFSCPFLISYLFYLPSFLLPYPILLSLGAIVLLFLGTIMPEKMQRKNLKRNMKRKFICVVSKILAHVILIDEPVCECVHTCVCVCDH